MINKTELLNEYKFNYELHAHSNPVSPCSNFDTKTLVQYMIEDGFDGFTLTNHYLPEKADFFGTAEKYAEFYLNDYNEVCKMSEGKLKVSLGMEIRFRENNNDYLLYGIDEKDIEKVFYYIDKGIDIFYKEFLRCEKKEKGKKIILQAHPFRSNMILANPESVDGIEVFNMHQGHNSKIAMAAKYASEHKSFYTSGGSDFHHAYQRGLFSMRIKKVPENSYEVSELIKSRDFIYKIGDSIILP